MLLYSPLDSTRGRSSYHLCDRSTYTVSKNRAYSDFLENLMCLPILTPFHTKPQSNNICKSIQAFGRKLPKLASKLPCQSNVQYVQIALFSILAEFVQLKHSKGSGVNFNLNPQSLPAMRPRPALRPSPPAMPVLARHSPEAKPMADGRNPKLGTLLSQMPLAVRGLSGAKRVRRKGSSLRVFPSHCIDP